MQQGFLNQIFGQLPISADKPIEIAEQWAVVAGHQCSECHLVPCLNRCHQLLVTFFLHRARLADSFHHVLFPVTSESHKRFAGTRRVLPGGSLSVMVRISAAWSYPQADYSVPSKVRSGEESKSLLILSEWDRGDGVIYNCRTRA